MNQIRVLLVSPDPQLKEIFAGAFAKWPGCVSAVRLGYDLDAAATERALARFSPAVVFVSLEDPARGEHVAKLIQRTAPAIPIVGITIERSVEAIRDSIRAGMSDLLLSPITAEELEDVLVRAYKAYLKTAPPSRQVNHIFAFVAAKPGCGATTVALHASLELARHTGLKTLLLDLDQGASVLDFTLNLPSRPGLRDAVEYGSQLDENVWQRLVSRVGEIDFVGLGTAVTTGRLTTEALDIFLTYAQNAYDIVCLDLASLFDDLSIPIMQRCSSIFLVCTPELAPLHMASRRIQSLRNHNLADRTRVIVNRFQPRSALSDSIREVLEAKVFATIPNAYETLQKTIQDGRPLDRRTSVGRSFSEVARKLTGNPKRKDERRGLLAAIRTLIQPSNPVPQLPAPPAKVIALPPVTLGQTVTDSALIKYKANG
jgi:pilus assembly protein CpaE